MFLKSLVLALAVGSSSAGVSHHSGFASLASPETYLEACAAADVTWFKHNYPNMIEPHSVNKLHAETRETCAHLAAYNSDQAGNVEIIRRFLNSGGRITEPLRVETGRNPTPMAVNVMEGNLDAVRMMLEHHVATDAPFRNTDDDADPLVNVMDVALEFAEGKEEGSAAMKIVRLLDFKGARASDGRGAPAVAVEVVEEIAEEVEEEIEAMEEIVEEVVEVAEVEVVEEQVAAADL